MRILLLLVSSFAFAKDPITHETLWMMKRVAAPVISPDGKWVVFSLTEPSYNEADAVSDLWIVPYDGSAKPRRLTATKGGESGASWSPDSRRIAFSAKREGDEQAQIYLLDVTGGEAQRLTNLTLGATAPRFSPDGKQILFSSKAYIGAKTEEDNKKAAADRKARKYKARVYETFPIRNWDRWLDDTEPHIFVQAVDGGAAADLLANPGELKLAEGQPVWTPDSKSIVFSATRNANAAAYEEVLNHIYSITLSGELKQLTKGNASYSMPRFRPDGKALYALRELSNDKVFNISRLVKLEWPNVDEPLAITLRLDASVGSYVFTSDSKSIYFTAEQAGLEKLFFTPAIGGDIRPVTDTASGVYTAIDSAEKAPDIRLAGLWSSATNPAEVVRVDTETRKHSLLTDFNVAKAAAIDWLPLRHFTFTSKRGRQIHNMIALPPNFDENKKYPLFVEIHGGPHSMWRDEITLRWNYHLLAAPGYIVLLTNYTGSTGFGERFAQQIQGDPLKTPGDEVNEAADEAIKRFSFIDGARQCAGGASYGGHLANWLQATTTRYRCLISHAGLINLESQWGTSDSIYHREKGALGPVWEQGKVWREQNPIRFAKHFKTPILVTVGENDFRVPLNQTIENWSVLQRLKVPSRLVVFPDANHWILKPEDSRYFFAEVHEWLAKHLKN